MTEHDSPSVFAPADERPLDPLRYGVALPFSQDLFPLGFPVRLHTNSAEVIAAAHAAWSGYSRVFDTEPVEFRLAVALDSKAPRPPACIPTGQGNLVTTVHSHDNFVVADVARGFAFGWLTPGVAKDQGYLRYHFLEPIIYIILDCLYLTPIHAGCVSLNGSGILLCGASGAGKTSLAYALARKGWTYVADDATHLVRGDPDRRVLGRPLQIRFRQTARSLFPELQDHPVVARPNGKLDLEIATAGLHLPSVAMEARADFLVFLKREPDVRAELSPWNAEDAARALARVICIGEEVTRRDQLGALRELVKRPCYVLRYSDFNTAHEELSRLISREEEK